MRKLIEMTTSEFGEQLNRTEWKKLVIGEIFVDKDDDGKWHAFEVLGFREGYDNREQGEPILQRYDIRII